MSGSAETGPARPQDLAPALALLDTVFLRERGRSGSIAARYAPLFGASGQGRLFVARRSGRVVAVTVSRNFALRVDGVQHPGCMIGFVATLPDHRGAGHASRLVTLAAAAARAEGRRFCVLWAQAQAFYRRLGWHAGDRGLLCEAAPLGPGPVPAAAEADARIEALAERSLAMRVARTPEWYGVVPVSAERVRCYVAGPQAAPRAWAIVGESADARFVYELGGGDADLMDLLTALRADPRTLAVNARHGDTLHRLAAGRPGFGWRAQQLAMWMPLVPGLDDLATRGWHVPWFDRI